MKNKFIFLILGIILLTSVASMVSAYDTHEKGKDYQLVVNSNNATSCNLSYTQNPKGELTIFNSEMNQDGRTFYINVTSGNFTNQGVTCLGISCTDGSTNKQGSKCLDITLSGLNPNSTNHIVSLSILFLIFGIAGVFLFLAFKVDSPGIKLFFVIASFVFLIGSLIIGYVVAFESNLTESINSTIITMIYAFGFIFFVVIAYIMLNQIKEAVSSIQSNKGYEVGF